uniref:CCHC-type domain-containing protein n=1 Tax=Magallana gigas TaxID=29159 RepID=A0A8W8MH65_MAGGI
MANTDHEEDILMEEDTAHRPPEQNTANAFALTDAVKLLSTAISTQFQQFTEKLQEDNKSSAQQLSKKFKENIAGKLKYEGNKLSALALQQTNTLQTNAGASNSFNQPFRSGSRRTPQPSDVCYRCFQTGHWKTRCPLNISTSSNPK